MSGPGHRVVQNHTLAQHLFVNLFHPSGPAGSHCLPLEGATGRMDKETQGIGSGKPSMFQCPFLEFFWVRVSADAGLLRKHRLEFSIAGTL